MAIRNIYKVSNKEELEFLRKKSKIVDAFDLRLSQLVDDMKETMIKANGAGLSAVQVGVLKRVFIIADKDEIRAFINPVILEESGENPILEEGCLSVPNKYGYVKRPNKVKVKAQNIKGEFFVKTYTGFEAKAICHENDHLDGILYTDREIEKPKSEKQKKDNK